MLRQTLTNIAALCLLLLPFGSKGEQSEQRPKQIIIGTWYEVESATMNET